MTPQRLSGRFINVDESLQIPTLSELSGAAALLFTHYLR